MVNYAIIEGGVVTSVESADEPFAENWIASDIAQIGWTYDGVEFAEPEPEPEPEPVLSTYAVIESGVVTNTVVSDEATATDRGWVIASLGVSKGHTYDGTTFAAPAGPTDADKRAVMLPISPLQGILTLGETEWGKVLAFRNGVGDDGSPLASWQQKVVIDNAADWVRTSQNIAFFGYLLNYTEAQMDTLFAQAAQVVA